MHVIVQFAFLTTRYNVLSKTFVNVLHVRSVIHSCLSMSLDDNDYICYVQALFDGKLWDGGGMQYMSLSDLILVLVKGYRTYKVTHRLASRLCLYIKDVAFVQFRPHHSVPVMQSLT
jgi:hypothetical protein